MACDNMGLGNIKILLLLRLRRALELWGQDIADVLVPIFCTQQQKTTPRGNSRTPHPNQKVEVEVEVKDWAMCRGVPWRCPPVFQGGLRAHTTL